MESRLPAVSSQTDDARKDEDVAETLVGTGCALGPSPPGQVLCPSAILSALRLPPSLFLQEVCPGCSDHISSSVG